MTTPYASEAFLHQILSKAIAAEATDVHLKVGKPPGARVQRSMVYFKVDNLRPEDTEAAARVLFNHRADLEKVAAGREIVGSCAVPGLARFRVHAYRQRGTIAIVMRVVPFAVPSLTSLGVPAAVKGMSEQESGLVLIAGSACSGRTSTMAAIIGHINASFPKHIVTVEDPIEFLHEDSRASVSQREVGLDTESVESGLLSALRQDADVIMASDIRNETSLRLALDAAELGRLVIAGVASPNVERALQRLIAMGSRPGEIRERLASSVQGVVAQRLLPKQEEGGLVLAAEVLVVTAPVREAIRRLHDVGSKSSEAVPSDREGQGESSRGPSLRTLMEKGANTYGSQTFDLHIRALAEQGLLSKEILAML